MHNVWVLKCECGCDCYFVMYDDKAVLRGTARDVKWFVLKKAVESRRLRRKQLDLCA